MSLMAGWERADFEPGGGDAFLSYVVFGVVPGTLRLPRVAADVPDLLIRRFTAAEQGETMRAFIEGPDMRRLEKENPALAELARGVSECALVSVAVNRRRTTCLHVVYESRDNRCIL